MTLNSAFLSSTFASSPLDDVPIHLAAQILTHLDCISDVRSAIHSHDVFDAAFNDHPRFVTRSVFTNQIPLELRPFAWAVYESTRLDLSNPEAAGEILGRLEGAIVEPDNILAALATVPLVDALAISDTFATIQDLIADFAKDVVSGLDKKWRMNQWRVNHPGQLSVAEQYRLFRAFYRFELLCKLFGRKSGMEHPEQESASRDFFEMFSPWVNEQLTCAYTYLERKLYIAFDEVAAHNVAWGELPVQWDVPAARCPPLQDFLACGLQFLDGVRRAHGYDEWVEFFRLEERTVLSHDCYISNLVLMSHFPDNERVRLGLGSDRTFYLYGRLGAWSREEFDVLAQASDGEYDSIGSGPFQAWYKTFEGRHSCHWKGKVRLAQLGYVIWDYPEFDAQRFHVMVNAIEAFPPLFNRVPWIREDVKRSWDQRTDIWLAGGEGYWTLDDYNFDRIRGLSEESKKRLVKRWRAEKKQKYRG